MKITLYDIKQKKGINNVGEKHKPSNTYNVNIWCPDTNLSTPSTCVSVCSMFSNHGKETAHHRFHVLSSCLEHPSNGAALQLEKGIIKTRGGRKKGKTLCWEHKHSAMYLFALIWYWYPESGPLQHLSTEERVSVSILDFMPIYLLLQNNSLGS